MKRSVQTFRDKLLFGPASHFLRAMLTAQGRLAASPPDPLFFSVQFSAPPLACRGIRYPCLLDGVLLPGLTGPLCLTVVCLRSWVPRNRDYFRATHLQRSRQD